MEEKKNGLGPEGIGGVGEGGECILIIVIVQFSYLIIWGRGGGKF